MPKYSSARIERRFAKVLAWASVARVVVAQTKPWPALSWWETAAAAVLSGVRAVRARLFPRPGIERHVDVVEEASRRRNVLLGAVLQHAATGRVVFAGVVADPSAA